MAQIKIDNVIYGSNNASDIIYKNTTVEEKLDTIPIFDPSDNVNIENAKYDYLTYGNIIDNLNSNATDKVLSANQGRILKESIENIDLSYLENDISNNTDNINLLDEKITNVNNELNNKIATNISNIEKNTNSIATNTANINSLFSAIELRYNETDDMVEIFYNNTWHPWKAGHLQTYEELIPMTGGSISASSTYSSSYPVSNLLSDSGTWYGAKNDTKPSIIYDFPQDVLINNLYMSAAEIGTWLNAPTNFEVYFSKDDINYTKIGTYTFSVAEGKCQIYFDNNRCSRIKIQFTSANDTADGTVGLGRLKIRGRIA